MSDIKWTRAYDLRVDNRHFRVFVSEHGEGGFHASCLWYEKGRILKAPDQPGSLSFQLEQRHASTEQQAVAQIKEWVESKFGGSVTLEPSAG